jgi:ATP adenylyltransferase/5',5'''-P-1,P-4-tetraphosphate phosphorylase II
VCCHSEPLSHTNLFDVTAEYAAAEYLNFTNVSASQLQIFYAVFRPVESLVKFKSQKIAGHSFDRMEMDQFKVDIIPKVRVLCKLKNERITTASKRDRVTGARNASLFPGPSSRYT